MLKLFLLVLAFWLIATIFRHRRTNSDPAQPAEKTGNMVRCASCGVYVPETDAIVGGGQYYCCEAHLLQHQNRA